MRPVLTVTKTTSTATVNNTSTGTTAPTPSSSRTPRRAPPRRTSPSPTRSLSGFTYASTGAITYTGTASRTSTTNPTVGAAAPAWSEFNIPAVEREFDLHGRRRAGVSGDAAESGDGNLLRPSRARPRPARPRPSTLRFERGEDVNVVAPPYIDLAKIASVRSTAKRTDTRPGRN